MSGAWGRLPAIRLQDSVAVFATAMTGFSLEIFLLCLLRVERAQGLDAESLLVAGQAFLIIACLVVYAAGRRFIRPIAALLQGIEAFGKGGLDRRIPTTGVRELDQLAAQLNAMAEGLRSLDRLKDGLIANVSHELRSPLAAMDGLAKVTLAEAGLSPAARDNLGRFSANLARLRRLVDNLLELSQVEAGGLRVERSPLDASAVAREVCSLFEAQAKAREVALEVAAGGAPPRAVADPAYLRQILVNLVDNAIKYNQDGGRVDVSVGAQAGWVVVSVADTGPGIATEHRGQLFQRFRRLPSPSRSAARVKGVGLGLAISRELARAMGGELALGEGAAPGAVFRLTLPREAP